MVEGARLESVYTLIAYRGFESLSLRHLKKIIFINNLHYTILRLGQYGDSNALIQGLGMHQPPF